jgi:phosphoribosyl 1,2-cyclic phosphodiesterase
MRFASLGSGSEGNGLIVESCSTRILIDCGFGIKSTVERLARLDVEPRSLTAILVTHEHSDHIGGVPAFAARYDIPVWATFGTLASVSAEFEGMTRVYGFDSHECFVIEALQITPICVPHDAREPVQYVIGDGARRLGVLTDLGVSTAHVEACLSGCHALVLECNHDPDMLVNGDYTPALKHRIASKFGHLDNGSAAKILERIDTSRLTHIIAAHLSKQNNLPELARAALAGALDCTPEWIGIADQDAGFDWREIV